MKIVVTNDDGHDAPGLVALYNAACRIGETVVVAPEAPQSGVGHSITLRGGIYAGKVSPCKYIVRGTPADCARLALKIFVPDADWVISGINPGANLGTDIYPSGTVAAAREAAIMGVKAAAVSQCIAPEASIDWRVVEYHAARILPEIMAEDISEGKFWNVNLPHTLEYSSDPEFRHCFPDTNPHDFIFEKNSDTYSYAGDFHERPRSGGSDVDLCLRGFISLTLLEV